MTKRREPSQYGQTHSIVVDDWKPSNAGQSAPVQGTQVSNTPDVIGEEDIPF
jgi:hypothetical protein